MQMSKKAKGLSCFLAVLLTCTVIRCYAGPAFGEEAVKSSDAEAVLKTSRFQASGRIWIAGDSIAADHSYENEANYARFVHGWGEMIGNYLTEDAQVFNQAISGQTAKFFTEEANYQEIMSGIGEGDFLLIQFGHNDYKSAGSDHSTLPTETEGSYKWYLKHYYIDPALEAGAMPVLCTSVVLCNFNEDVISENQAQKKFVDAMKELYQEYCEQGIEIGLIDAYSLTETMLNADSAHASEYYALKKDRSAFYNKSIGETGVLSTSLDHVHFSEKGADATADIIAQNLFLMYHDFNRFNKKGFTDGGSGTQDDPFLISSFAQFYQILQDESRNTPQTYYKLMKDLTPSIQRQQWKTVFNANLDGGSHTLKNVFGTSMPAFLDENRGVIQNLNLEYHLDHDADEFQYSFVKDNYGIIENCQSKGTIALTYYPREENSLWHFGALAAVNHEGAILRRCGNDTRITLDTDATHVFLGGMTGRNAGTISDCKNDADLNIITSEYTSSNAPTHPEIVCCGGGIAGIASNDSQIVNCSGGKNPKCITALQAEASVILTDAIVPVNDKELQDLLGQSSTQPPNVTETPLPTQPALPLQGDFDKDGNVSLSDAQFGLLIALGIEKESQEFLKLADIDRNGAVDLNDALAILKMALSISDS